MPGPRYIGVAYLSIRQLRYSLANLRHASSLVPLFNLIHFRYPEMMCLHSPKASQILISSIGLAGLAEFLRDMDRMTAGWRTFVIKRKATALGSANRSIESAIIQSKRSDLVHSLDNMLQAQICTIGIIQLTVMAYSSPTHRRGLRNSFPKVQSVYPLKISTEKDSALVLTRK